ncbi:protein of unknown function [Xenorhabdus poinarii G6]|uniref:Uncharacterized protein n=1 Tax=Xenorhabdus poinarii G6 TaxID=1354304 RepID=A0A068R4W9_9GAMM|nr:protein of unknown function [Xenorhabdus poinarii G6]
MFLFYIIMVIYIGNFPYYSLFELTDGQKKPTLDCRASL